MTGLRLEQAHPFHPYDYMSFLGLFTFTIAYLPWVIVLLPHFLNSTYVNMHDYIRHKYGYGITYLSTESRPILAREREERTTFAQYIRYLLGYVAIVLLLEGVAFVAFFSSGLNFSQETSHLSICLKCFIVTSVIGPNGLFQSDNQFIMHIIELQRDQINVITFSDVILFEEIFPCLISLIATSFGEEGIWILLIFIEMNKKPIDEEMTKGLL
ncbi:hypothetical protein ACJX0J_019490 [Zea mays]